MVENVAEHQQEDRADEVDHANRNVERISLLVHVGRKDADSDQEYGLDDDERNSLCDAAALCQSDEHAFDQNVD